MRPLLYIGILVAGLLLTLLYFIGGAERDVRPESTGVDRIETADDARAGEVLRDADGGRRLVSDPGASSGNAAPSSPAADRAPGLNLRASWLEDIWAPCVQETDGEALRDCLRERLAGLALAPEALAELVCGQDPPDAFDQVFVEEVAWTWSPAAAPGNVLRFQRACGSSGQLWAGFVLLQAERDPVWLEAFATTILAEGPGADGGLALLFCTDALAGLGYDGMSLFMDRFARGESRATDDQVAYAISSSYALRADATEGLEFLLGVARSPNFQGRPAEVTALARRILEGSSQRFDPERTLAVFRDLLADPLLGPGFAGHVLDLALWDRLPLWLSEPQKTRLIEDARRAR